MILVTGTSGALGGQVLAGLAAEGDVEVVAGSRSGDGTAVRRIDFDEPATLAPGFRGTDVLVFVSAGFAEDDVVVARHGAVVAAAAEAGVRHVVYTSLAGSGDLLTIALAHRWTEARLAAAPYEVTVLRNGLYAELGAVVARWGASPAAESGEFATAMGTGRFSAVARQDLADVAVRVAAEAQRDLAAGRPNRHAGRTYALEGVSTLGGGDLAEALGESLGRPVSYRPVPLAEARAALERLGLLPPFAIVHTVSQFANTGAGLLVAGRSDLPGLLTAEPRSARAVLGQALAAAPAG